MLTLWQGSANTWDCDEMGHMNVRIYIEKALEGLGRLAQLIDMPDAFRSGAFSTLSVTDHHIRYIREVRPGRPLVMHGCVLEINEHDAVIYQEMRHGDGQAAAAFHTRVSHIHTKSGKAFPWSRRTRAALEKLRAIPPADTRPRSIEPDGPSLPPEAISREVAIDLGAPMIGTGMVLPGHCDLHGRMNTEWFMGRISDSVPNLLFDWRKEVANTAGHEAMGAAVLEYRLIYRERPKAGDTFEIYASFARAEEKIHSLVYWMVDPVTGKPWMTSEAVAVTFDLETRKIIPAQKEHLEQLAQLAPKGLTI